MRLELNDFKGWWSRAEGGKTNNYYASIRVQCGKAGVKLIETWAQVTSL